MINPHLPTNNQVYFGCTLNETNFVTGVRRNLIRATTTINEGILLGADTVFGNLVFKNSLNLHSVSVPERKESGVGAAKSEGLAVAGSEPLNPREAPELNNPLYTSLHQFWITLDIANLLIPTFEIGYKITDSPVLYITFPEDYNFSYFSFVPNCKIESYRLNSTDLKTVELFNHINVASTQVLGNQIVIRFVETTIEFDKYFQHFVIKLFNLPAPSENTAETSINKITTGTIEMLLINSTKK